MARAPFLNALLAAGVASDKEIDGLQLRFGARHLDIASHLYTALEAPVLKARLGQLYAASIGKDAVALDRATIQAEALACIGLEAARRLNCLPLQLTEQVLVVAMARPDDAYSVAEVGRAMSTGPSAPGGQTGQAKCTVQAVFAFAQDIENGIEVQYTRRAGLAALARQISQELSRPSREAMASATATAVGTTGPAASASVSGAGELVRGLLLYSLKHRASDIHIQPMANALALRFRIDGLLQTRLTLDKDLLAPLLSHLKLIANLDFAEKRRPQDGRISLIQKGRSHDFRLSIVPSVFGEKAVIRVVGSSDQRVTPLDELGFSHGNHALLTQLIQRPHGVLLVTGPTGSGKTTTLYAALARLHSPEINIVTVEDPVELRIDGVTQIQTHAAIGLDFAQVLRAVLRQDPEVLLIGEIRDLETARIATQAALTGHLVMATLHTNSALQAVTRLVEIGVPPFLVAPSVIGVLAQRLVRRICPHCKERYEPSPDVLEALFHNRGEAPVHFCRGRGCQRCHGSGYVGRMGIHEVFVLTDTIRDLIARQQSLIEIQRAALQHGFRSMRHDGVLKVLQGLTTLEEVDKATAW
ncbi:type II/IV secretion system protein [Hylemonella gracilis]|jgi:type IV pilus assembly protein PilB|uniref:Type II/IV secretion system protein n=1 Tax=Hylemonella gracilis TaxID=80880 RepID=A0A4P6ULJ6_9BURK|nr:GspE/PulE family protein [Hylemonella gracilis]QBK05050.1 type II/IV secretion system protein [Hylemonella gracilis]